MSIHGNKGRGKTFLCFSFAEWETRNTNIVALRINEDKAENKMIQREMICIKDILWRVCLSDTSVRRHIPNVDVSVGTWKCQIEWCVNGELCTEDMTLKICKRIKRPSNQNLDCIPIFRILTNSKFLLVIMLGLLSLVFHTLTLPSVLPVAMHPVKCGLISKALTAPSCACRVKMGLVPTPLSAARTSKYWTTPSSVPT